MTQRDALDEIVDDLVVFKHANGDYFSNNPFWHDSRVQERWMARHSDEAKVDNDEDGIPDEEEVPDYSTWTNEDLRAELVTRKLSVDGKKDAMVARLIADDEAAGE